MYAHVSTHISFIFYLSSFILSLSCSPSTDPNSENSSPRERVTVSGSLMEDTVWEFGKEYYVTGGVTVEAGATLTIQPEVVVKFAHERADFPMSFRPFALGRWTFCLDDVSSF